MKSIAIIGAGGCARELAWLIEDISADASDEASRYTPVGFLVSDTNRLGPYDSPILGDFSWLAANHVDASGYGYRHSLRQDRTLPYKCNRHFPHIEWPALVHPSVMWQRQTIQVGEGVIHLWR